MRVYLAGPINGCTDAQANGWRSAAKALHRDCLDPMDRDYRGSEQENAAEIVDGDKRDIAACDAVLVWYERPSVGTSMEVLYAHGLGKRVVVVNCYGAKLSPWLTHHATCVVSSIEDGMRTAVGGVS